MTTSRNMNLSVTTQSTRRASSLKVVNLRPLKRKLDRIETERVYRVTERCLRDLCQVETLLWLVKDDLNLFRITDAALRQLVIYHQNIINQMDDGDSDSEHTLRKSTQAILRYCTSNAISLSDYRSDFKEARERDRESLVGYFDELRDMMLQRLLTESEEDNARCKYLLKTMEKARIAQSMILQLSQSYKNCVANKDKILNDKEREILHLKQRSHSKKTTVDEEIDTALNKAAKQILKTRKALKTKEFKSYQEIHSSSERIAKSRGVHYKKESKLRKRKFKLAGELQNWILKYDQNMEWRQEQIDELTILNNRDLEDLKELETHFEETKKHYDEITEERRKIAKEKEMRETAERQLNDASVKIQAMWRGYKTRKYLSKPPGRKGGKKKGGKKGGKKKK